MLLSSHMAIVTNFKMYRQTKIISGLINNLVKYLSMDKYKKNV